MTDIVEAGVSRAEAIHAARPLRILFLRNLFSPRDLGGNRYPVEVTTRLARRGHELTVVSSTNPGTLGPSDVPTGALFRPYPSVRLHPATTYLSHALLSAATLARLPVGRFDLAVAASYDVALAACYLPTLRRLPLVFIYHSEFYSVWAKGLQSRRRGLRGLPGRAVGRHMEWAERVVLQRSERIVAVSEFSRRQILERAPRTTERVRVVPTGVATSSFVPANRAEARQALGFDPDRPVVIGVGRLTPVKRFDRLVRAAAELAGEGVSVQLALVGGGPEADGLARLARELGIGDAVRMAGFQDAHGVRRYMQAADLQVCSSEFENHSLAILEALACGTPVVGTRTGGTPEILEQVDARLLLADADPGTIAGTLAGLLADETELERLRRRCRDVAVQRYDWESIVSSLEAVFAEAAGRHSERGEEKVG